MGGDRDMPDAMTCSANVGMIRCATHKGDPVILGFGVDWTVLDGKPVTADPFPPGCFVCSGPHPHTFTLVDSEGQPVGALTSDDAAQVSLGR
jgi:hypothetical protein